MKDFVQNLINIPSSYIVIALIAVFYLLEYLQTPSSKGKGHFEHLFNNLLFFICVIAFSYSFALLEVMSVSWMNEHHIGLLHYVHIPFLAKLIIAIACLDFTSYWFHRLSHHYAILWSLHRIHHSDTAMDTSTFFRHHPFEIFISIASSLVASAIFGLDAIDLGFYFFILIPSMIVQHSNFKFPIVFDKIIGKILVTPNFHKVHHSQDQMYTDSNFADIFIIWDKLFGTFQAYRPDKITYGLKEFNEEEKQDFWFLIKSPFQKMAK